MEQQPSVPLRPVCGSFVDADVLSLLSPPRELIVGAVLGLIMSFGWLCFAERLNASMLML